MREIKFRAWDKHNKEMILSHSIRELNIIDWNLITIKLNHLIQSHSNLKPHTKYTNNIILMQYTGLTDINGKEIYEGDIVLNHKKKSSKTFNKGVVVFTNGSVRIRFKQNENAYHEHYIDNWIYNGKLHDIEVIGNKKCM